MIRDPGGVARAARAPPLARRAGDGHAHRFRPGESGPRCSLATGGTYNRVEGLPIVFGPLSSSGPRSAPSPGSTCAASSAPRARPRAQQRLRLRQPGRSADSRQARVRHRRAALQRGRADRGPAALASPNRLVRLPPPARLPRLLRAAGVGGVGLGPAAPRRCGSSSPCGRDRGALGAGHRSVVAVPQQRSLAPQPADRRRPLLHHRPAGRSRHPERS